MPVNDALLALPCSELDIIMLCRFFELEFYRRLLVFELLLSDEV